jgi:hypothetical protein
MWVLDDPEKDKIIVRQINRLSDRPAAIVACSYLERGLEQALRAQLKGDKAIVNAFLKGMGPLATFTSRIDLALLLGIIPSNEWQQCFHSIRRIRNLFAHEAAPLNFDSPELVKPAKHLMDPRVAAANLERGILDQIDDREHPRLLKLLTPLFESFKRADGTLRSNYIGSAQLCLFALKIWIATRGGGSSTLTFHGPSRKKSS